MVQKEIGLLLVEQQKIEQYVNILSKQGLVEPAKKDSFQKDLLKSMTNFNEYVKREIKNPEKFALDEVTPQQKKEITKLLGGVYNTIKSYVEDPNTSKLVTVGVVSLLKPTPETIILAIGLFVAAKHGEGEANKEGIKEFDKLFKGQI